MAVRVRMLIRRYLDHQIGLRAAALAFYLLFMTFPLLIFLSALLGLLRLDVAAVAAAIEGFVPREAVEIAVMYLHHVSAHASASLAVFALGFSLYFPARAANALLQGVRLSYGLGPPKGALRQAGRSLAFAVLLLATLGGTLTVLSVSERALWWAVGEVGLPRELALLWERLRFPAAGAAGFFTVGALYALAQDAPIPWRQVWPGTAFALVGWLALSRGYHFYVEHLTDYSALYGSLGAVIVLVMWLYLSAAVLLVGAEVNGIIKETDKGERNP